MDWLRLNVLAGLGHKLLLERYLRHEVFTFQYFSLVFPTLKNERRKRKLVSFASTNLAEFSGQKVAPASYRSQALFLVNKSLSLAKN